MYQFTHPYAHRIIYDLTPSSERKNMHQIIADYIEHTNFDDPSNFVLLTRHNAQCNPEKAFHYTFKAITHLLEQGTTYEIGQCVDLLHDALPLLATVVDADVLQIMIYNVRRRVEAIGEETSSVKMSTRAANAIVGGLYGAVNALSNRWKGKSKAGNVVTPLSIIDEGVSTKSGKSWRSTGGASAKYEVPNGNGAFIGTMNECSFVLILCSLQRDCVISVRSAALQVIAHNSHHLPFFVCITQQMVLAALSVQRAPPVRRPATAGTSA